MAITSAMVKALREKTGLPMMECKRALEETGGDEAQAIEVLRKKGLAQATKRAGRATAEGRIVFQHDPSRQRAVLVEVLCETEPVSGTEDFLKLGKAAAQAAVALDDPTPEKVLQQPMPDQAGQTIDDYLKDIVNRIRENIKLGRVALVSGDLGFYLHHDGRKGVLVEMSEPATAEVCADVCMHIAAMRPQWLRREDVDAKLVEEERAIAKEQVKGKPENIVDKIVAGKLDKWYAESVLLEQAFVKDDKKSVGQYLREVSPNLTVKRMVRIEIGDE